MGAIETTHVMGDGARTAASPDSFDIVPSAGVSRSRRALLATPILAFVAVALVAWAPAAVILAVLASLLWLQAAAKLGGVAFSPAQDVGDVAKSQDLPRYTVLVPLYHETASVPGLLRGLRALDYPRERLDILILCESDDDATCEAVRAELKGGNDPARLTVVPSGGPRTKSNALCHALKSVSEGLVTIYDAEDIPHPGQLKAAARAFASDPSLVAVQAPLVIDNRAPGWITRQFAYEYAALFYVWLPWLVRLGLPIPLGGTSNHVRFDALHRAGGWDAYNVTEDADLTYRLALEPWARFGWIAPPTSEEAVADWSAWRRQRTRWMKGFAQTWIAHAGRGGGFRRKLSLHLTIGLTLLSGLLHVGVLLGVMVLGLVGADAASPLLALGAALWGSGILVAAVGARRAGKRLGFGDALAMPLYWMLLTVPAWIAMWELLVRPHYWSKTRHGVAARKPPIGEPATAA